MPVGTGQEGFSGEEGRCGLCLLVADRLGVRGSPESKDSGDRFVCGGSLLCN